MCRPASANSVSREATSDSARQRNHWLVEVFSIRRASQFGFSISTARLGTTVCRLVVLQLPKVVNQKRGGARLPGETFPNFVPAWRPWTAAKEGTPLPRPLPLRRGGGAS